MAQSHTYPFICRRWPFVRHGSAHNLPNIGLSVPFVRFTAFSGFTLTELITTLAIAGILAVMVVPAMTQFVESNRLTTVTNEFIASVNAARSEAIKRGLTVVMCKSNSGAGCTGAGTTWKDGWILFADLDSSTSWTASDVMLNAHERAAGTVDITITPDIIKFSRLGTVDAGAGTYQICNTKIHKTRSIQLMPIGQTAITEGSC